MAAQALAAQAVASRLQRQEEDIRWLCAEVQRLRDEQLRGSERGQAEGPRLTREVAQLRAENRDLRQRLSGLRLRLAEQRDPGARRAAAQEVTRRASGDAAQAHALGGGLQLSAPRRRGQGCRVCPRRRPARCLRPRGNRWVFTNLLTDQLGQFLSSWLERLATLFPLQWHKRLRGHASNPEHCVEAEAGE